MKSIRLLTLLLLGHSLFASSYSVPVPEELKSYSTWEQVEANAFTDGQKIVVDYQLPTDLVGTKLGRIHFEGKKTAGDFVAVNGQKVHGICMLSDEKPMTCMLKYPLSIVDESTRDASLQKHFSGSELDIRTRVVRLFGADPAGLLSVSLK